MKVSFNHIIQSAWLGSKHQLTLSLTLIYMHRLKISHTSDSPCGMGHILQNCPTHTTERLRLRPAGADLKDKLLDQLMINEQRSSSSRTEKNWRKKINISIWFVTKEHDLTAEEDHTGQRMYHSPRQRERFSILSKWWWWLFPRVRGFWEYVWLFISRLCFFFLLFKWGLARTHQFHFLSQNESTVAQRAETTVTECSPTSSVWARFVIGSRTMPGQRHSQPIPTSLGQGCIRV